MASDDHQNAADQVVEVEGDLVRGRVARVAEDVDRALSRGENVLLDLTRLGRFDSAGIEFLVRRLKEAQGRVRLRRARPELRAYLEALPPPDVFRGEVTSHYRMPIADLLVDTASGAVEQVSRKVTSFSTLFLQIIYFCTIGPFRGHRLRTDRTVDELLHVGIDAIPIVSMVAVLMGLILGFQSASQLEKFGGESLYIWSANLVGVSVTREIGPILTAILIAGRSGSAIAAEIGTMVVTEEIDALRVMGLNTVSFLIVPKILALMIALPCLVVIADLVGIGGGFVTGVVVLGVPFNEYLVQTRDALHLADVFTGLIKATVFGLLIGLTGAVHGLMVRGGSAEVGLRTTSAVVFSIGLVILSDLLFTVLFYLSEL